MRTRVAAVLALTLIASRSDAFAQDVDAGRKAFESRCARCHGGDGNGGEMGPPIAQRLPPLDDQSLSKLIHEGIPAKGMPPSVINDPEVGDLIRFLRTIQRRADDKPIIRGRFTLAELEPEALNDEAILRVCDLVDYEVDPRSTFPRHYTGDVQISLRDGRVLMHREAMNRGCADRPLSNAEIVEKFTGNARMRLSARQASGVQEAVLGLDRAADVRPVIDRICQAAP